VSTAERAVAVALSPLLSPAHLAVHATRHWTCGPCGGRGCDQCHGTGFGGWKAYRWCLLLNRALVALAARRIRRLIVIAPVRHGKSELATKWHAAWYLMTHPDHRVILTGHTQEFAELWGGLTRDIVAEHGPAVGVRVSPVSAARGRWDLALPHRGGLVAVGVGATPTGRGGNLVVIDDPIKSADEAYSPTYREKLWRWWQMGIRSRFEPDAVCVVIMSRWHEDDLVGRLLSRQEAGTWSDAEGPVDVWHVLHLPALADPAIVDPDPLGRAPGEPLCPQRFDAAALAEVRDGPSGVGPLGFLALYQGRPTSPEGGMFHRGDWRYADAPPAGLRWVRWWDLAATSSEVGGDPDWTAGVLMARDADGFCWIADVRRMRGEPGEVEHFLRSTAHEDAERWGCRTIRIPQDPGSAGKALVSHLVRNVLAGFDVRSVVQTGDKRVRALPLAAQVAAHNVYLVRGPWNVMFVDEAAQFDPPRSGHDDMVDAAAMAYQELAGLVRRKARVIV
jgi:predicted phage terminase large subunit-like protein